MRPPLQTILPLSSLLLLSLALPAFGADPSLAMKVTAGGYLDARGVSIMLYDDAFSPVFFDQKDAGMQIILHGNRIATNGSLRLLATPEQWDAIPTIKAHKPDKEHDRLTADLSYSDYHLDYHVIVAAEPGGVRVSVNLDQPLPVPDPAMGSGTVLAVARANGHQSFGVDLDPLAVLLAGVWTRTVDAVRVRDEAEEVLRNAKSIFKKLAARNAYPVEIDDETRKFIRYWFDSYTRRQLTSLTKAINRVQDKVTRDILWCGFSRLIITKKSGASLAMDLSHSRPHKEFKYAPVKPFSKFKAAIKIVVSNCPQSDAISTGPESVVWQGDARKLEVDDASPCRPGSNLTAIFERHRLYEVQ